MIQPHELREGNWVICYDSKKRAKVKEFPCQVSWRHIKALNVDKNGSEYNPVLLTTELLETCNWKPKDNLNIFYHPTFGDAPDTIVLVRREAGYSTVILQYDYYIGEPMQYLHQLQNRYYSLCNTEMQIDMKSEGENSST